MMQFTLQVFTAKMFNNCYAGRVLSFKESLREIGLLYNEYMLGRFDPFLEGTPLNNKKPESDWVTIQCIPSQGSELEWMIPHVPQFGFDNCPYHEEIRKTKSPYALADTDIKKVSWPFFICDEKGYLSEEEHKMFFDFSLFEKFNDVAPSLAMETLR